MTYQASTRAYQAAERRRLRDLERRAKEQARLAALSAAQREVDACERRVGALTLVHRCPVDRMDWAAEASSLPPPWPREAHDHEFVAQLRILDTLTGLSKDAGAMLDEARREDARELEGGKSALVAARNYAEKMRTLADRILRGETHAYAEAVKVFEPFNGLAESGWTVSCTFHHSTLCECELTT